MKNQFLSLVLVTLFIASIQSQNNPYWIAGGNPTAGVDGVTAANNILGTNGNFPVKFQTAGTTRMTILGNGGGTNGFVGIGITNPNNKLDVNGGDIDANSIATGYKINDKYVLWHNGDVRDIFVGVGAGNPTATLHRNTYVGNFAGTSSSNCGANTAVGYEALRAVVNSGLNCAFGYHALWKNTVDQNTAIGCQAMESTVTGRTNVAVGCQALMSDVDGVQNTAIGYRALRFNLGNTTVAPFQGIENTGVGSNVLEQNTFGNKNTGVGDDALADNTTGNNNIAVGSEAMAANTTGSGNTALGVNAMINSNGNLNSAVGQFAMLDNTSGERNCAFGNEALDHNVIGERNTVAGYRAGFGVATKSHSRNCFFGYEAGFAITQGTDNSFIGYQSGSGNTTGSNNTFNGNLSGTAIQTGNLNTIIGANANSGGLNAALLNNAAAIGSNAIVRANNSMILGDNSVKVGIGLSNDAVSNGPQNKLEINADPTNFNYTGTGGSGLRFRQLINTSSAAANNGTNTVLSVNSAGDVILVHDQTGTGGGATLGNVCGFTPQNALQNDWEIPLNGKNFVFSSNNNTGNVGIGGYNCSPTDKLTITGSSVENNTGVHITNVTNSSNSSAYLELTNDNPGNNALFTFHSTTFATPSLFELTTPGNINLSPAYSADINLKTAGGVVNVNSVNSSNIQANTSLAVHSTQVIENDPGFGSALTINSGPKTVALLGTVLGNAGQLVLYGSTSTSPSVSIPATGASMFFNTGGNVGINTSAPSASYKLDVNGSIQCIGFNNLSDSILKTNIQPISLSAINKVKGLRPVSFEWVTKIDSAMSGKQYGFTAQQVETIIPELVKTDSAGRKSLNYIGIIPLLTKAIQQQQAQIDSLMSIMSSCCNNNSRTTNNNIGKNSVDVELSDADIIVLNQNQPNPFAEQTMITYQIPQNTGFAQILFYDINGRQIKAVDINKKGKGQLNVFANDLSNGIYSYTLVIDGKIIETKKMIKQQ